MRQRNLDDVDAEERGVGVVLGLPAGALSQFLRLAYVSGAGNVDVDRLDELFGVRPEGKDSTTVAGLVSELAGRIPQKGEVIEEDGLRIEVLESTERRVERVRISLAEPRQMKLI